MIAFGPLPSRRLGRSLGINHVPPKVCSYSCVYCQVGRTTQMRAGRCAFHDPVEIERAVRERVAGLRQAGERVDWLTFVPDGEPTLDVNLGREIALLRPLGIPIAVISNGSLLWREDVRAALQAADWVSLKVDAAREEVWRRVNRPHRALRLSTIREGLRAFAQAYRGQLVTETMLVAGVNDSEDDLVEVADFLASLKPSVAYISVPTRPPAETWVRPPAEATVSQAYQIFSHRLRRVELLVNYEGSDFAATGDVEAGLLGITAVHPMREEAVAEFLAAAGADWTVVRRLLDQGELTETAYAGHTFYVRRFPRRARSSTRSGGEA